MKMKCLCANREWLCGMLQEYDEADDNLQALKVKTGGIKETFAAASTPRLTMSVNKKPAQKTTKKKDGMASMVVQLMDKEKKLKYLLQKVSL